jgi:uncharacterized membrane protein YfcA
MVEWHWLAATAVVTGLVGGTVSGLLGVGGGIVIVPVLEAALGYLGVDAAVRMPIAVATSLATIVPTSISASRAHHRRGAIDFGIVKLWALPVAIGAVLGSAIASRADSRLLTGVFGGVAALMALKMLLPLDDRVLADRVPASLPARALPVGIGAISSMMGIGGGTLSVPALTLLGQPVHRAVGTANLLGLAIALPGTLGYLLAKPVAAVPPGTVGLVSLTSFARIAPLTVLAAPWGANLAHRLNRRHLSAAFGVFLSIVAARMLYRTLLPGA